MAYMYTCMRDRIAVMCQTGLPLFVHQRWEKSDFYDSPERRNPQNLREGITVPLKPVNAISLSSQVSGIFRIRRTWKREL